MTAQRSEMAPSPAAMVRAPRALRIGYVALAAADSVLAGSARPGAHRVRRATKTLLLPVLAGAFASDPRAAGSPVRATTLLGQACGWAGDVALLRPGLVPFAAGMGAFGAGHAAYVTGLRRLAGPRPVWRSRRAQLAASAFALTGPVIARGAWRQERVLGPAVLAYAALLTATTAHAGNLGERIPLDARRATLAGAVAFLLSDSLLGAAPVPSNDQWPPLDPV